MFQPMQITASVAGSIALARPEDLSLDGLLTTQVLHSHYGEDFYTLLDPKERLVFTRLPLEMRGYPSPLVAHLQTGGLWYDRASGAKDESFWYWACSRTQIEIKGRDTQYWNKRFDTQAALSDHIDFGVRVQKIIIEQGQFKAYHMPLPTLVCDRIVWYACGDVEQVAQLLQPLAAIGKKRSQGNGMVLRWEVEGVPEDYSEWKDGTLMRALPGPCVDTEKIIPLDMQYTAFRAPQWHPMNQTMCVTQAVKHG